ncbi:MAG: TRM11 family SAM-dependent methyltransferase [Aristaeellaceae bacterium]
MYFCFQLSPHANIRYREAQLKLGQAELQCLLQGLGLSCPVTSMVIGGVSFLTFEADELSPAQLSALSRHSAALMICEKPRVPEGSPVLLRPLEKVSHDYLTADLPEVLKYKGKTSAVFTRMMLNCAHAASDFFDAPQPLTVLDPMCGKGTTCFVALQQGMNAVGVDIDRRDLKEAADYFERHLQFHRLKHRLDQSSRTVRNQAIPAAVYTVADTKEHFREGDTRTLSLYLGDTGLTGELLKKQPAHLLVSDLPYGVQHAPQEGRRAGSFAQMMQRVLPAWHAALLPGGAIALSFNVLTLRREVLAQLLTEAGFIPLTESPYNDFEHFVETAVTRDFIVARRG